MRTSEAFFFGDFWNRSSTLPPGLPDSAGPAGKVFAIQRGDFWYWGFYAPGDSRVVQNRNIKLASADAKRAQLEIDNEWLIENKKLLDETDEVTVTERGGVYVIDLAYRLAPIVDYVLKRQAFGGFAVQGQKAGDHYYSTASGKVTLPSPYYSVPDLDWPAEPWYDYTIHLTRDGKVVGFAVLDHPLNPPTRWHDTVWLINPCITLFGEMTIHADEPLVLRYRVVVHDGPPPTELLQKLWKEWRMLQPNRSVAQWGRYVDVGSKAALSQRQESAGDVARRHFNSQAQSEH